MNDQNQTPPANDAGNDPKPFEMPKSVSFKSLKNRFGDAAKAAQVYQKICSIGGFGSVGRDFRGGYPALDLSGIKDADKLSRIEKLLK